MFCAEHQNREYNPTTNMSGNFIIVFKDSVTSEEISQQIREIEAAGGKLKTRWDGGLINGFSATIPLAFLETFKSLQADKISSIEEDGIVTTQ